MRSLHRPAVLGLVIIILVSVAFTAALAETPLVIGEHRRDTVLETPHPYPSGAESATRPVWSDHYYFADARYLVFEFQRFDLAPGDRVEIRDPKGRQVHVYEGKGFKDKGGDFISKMILGPEAYIDLYCTQPNPGHYGYRIERITRGYSTLELTELYPYSQYGAIEAICGGDDKEDALCYESPFPDVYDRARAVNRIVMDGSALCTAWLVSCENHVMTNNHCTWDDVDFDTQGELDRMEFQFMYEDSSCGGGDATVEYSFMGGTWLENNHNLDYTLIQAPEGENPAATYGWLLIDDRLAEIDETIYIVGHPSGRPKEISLYSGDASDQDNPDGFCEVFSVDEPACVGGGVPEVGYMCDTEGGNSGSPVLSRVTNKVVALHHCANCPNRGVRIQNVWAANQGGSFPLPACSLFADVGTVALDRQAYACTDTISIEVSDGSIIGAGAQNVTIWSGTEPAPETVTLVETGVDTGSFQGTIATSTVAPVAADGILSVADGDTITVEYIDADDGQGGLNIPRQDSAGVDCQSPVISNVQTINVLGSTASVTWDTDETADSSVEFSQTPPSWSTTSDADLVTAHQVNLTGLQECSTYGYQVTSADGLGQSASDDNGGQYYFFSTGVNVQPLFASTDTPQPVTDNTSTTSPVQVTDDETVLDVNVMLDITHTFAGDLDIYLMGPNGVEIELSTDNGGSGANYQGTTFDDDAPTVVTGGAAPFTGSFSPEQPLSTFNGLNATGTWTLRVHDDATGDTGTLDSWTLQLSYPARACGPQASYSSHALVADACSGGGAGDGDGQWDAGESVAFGVTVVNDGTDPLTGISATVVPLTPGVSVPVSLTSFFDLAPGASGSSLSTITAQLPTSVLCGDDVEFQIDISTNQGNWSNTFQQEAGLVISGGGVALDEDFEASGNPGNWTVVDGGTSTDTWFTDSVGDPAACNNTDASAPISGNWAAADSDCAGAVDMDESLITPVLDLSSALTVNLEFDHFFNLYQTEVADLDVRSSLTGGTWMNISSWFADTSNAQHESIDITGQAAGAADVEVRWHYYAANYEWYWYVDNVLVTFTAEAGCDSSTCLPSGAPGVQAGAYWPDLDDFTWSEDLAATDGYAVYRGTEADLPGLLDGSVDSCTRFTGVDSSDNLVDLSGDNPSGVAGGLYWYVITGWNGIGEGSAGDATAGPRVVNSPGACP